MLAAVVASIVGVTMAAPSIAMARPAASRSSSATSSTTSPPSGSALQAFEAGFAAGQQQFDAGEFLAAGRTWAAAAARLPETEEHRSNRAAIHEYMADAFERALAGSDEPALLREALAPLDRYAEQFAAAYPDAPLAAPVASTRDSLRARLLQLEAPAPTSAAAPNEAPPSERAPAPTGRPWKGLAAGGGVLLVGAAAMLGVFAFGYTRARAREREFDAPENGCSLGDPMGACADIYAAGKSANTTAVVGLVAAPLLLGAGAALVVLASRRRGAEQALAPALGRGFVGVTWQRRF